MPSVLEISSFRTDDASSSELDIVRKFLTGVFGPGFDEVAWQHSLGGVHFVLRYQGQLVTHLSIVPRAIYINGRDMRAGYVEAVATASQFRGRWFGTSLAAAASAYIVSEFDIGALATSTAISLYARLGWRIWSGKTFAERHGEVIQVGPQGCVMILAPKGVEINIDGNISTNWRDGDVW